jgi:two-component system sensor histidine kinase BarA
MIFVLLDINLGLSASGIEILKKLRQMENYRLTPVAAITANALKLKPEGLLKEGFSHYLAKPFTRNELKSLVKKMLNEAE